MIGEGGERSFRETTDPFAPNILPTPLSERIRVNDVELKQILPTGCKACTLPGYYCPAGTSEATKFHCKKGTFINARTYLDFLSPEYLKV